MTQEKAFLQAILAAPDDDAPRLIYADWLEERGDPRGEFIRGQCRLAGMQEWDEGYVELEARCGLLLRTHRKKWLGPLAPLVRDAPFEEAPQFVRGFPEVVSLEPAQFAARFDRLFTRAPIRGLHVEVPWDSDPERDFWSCEGLNGLRRIWVYRAAGRPPYPDAVLASPLWQVTDLGVPCDLVRSVPDAIASSPYAPRLQRLEIVSRQAGPSPWRSLWRAAFPNLKRLGFRTRGTLANHLALSELEAAAWFPRLERLELAGTGEYLPLLEIPLCRLLPAGRLRALALTEGWKLGDEAGHFRDMPAVLLEHLDLGQGRGIGKRELRALLRAPGFAGLRSFALSGNGEVALAALCDAPIRHSLRSLRLTGCRPSGLIGLARAGCPQMARLDVGLYAGRGDGPSLAAAVDALLDPRAFPRLVSLRVAHYGSLSADLPRLLGEHPAAGRLKELGLRFPVGEEDARRLAAAPPLDELDCLRIPRQYLGRPGEQRASRDALLQRFGPRLDAES